MVHLQRHKNGFSYYYCFCSALVNWLKLYAECLPQGRYSSCISPLGPKSDQDQISPCDINALYNRVVIRIKDMIIQDEFA